MRVCLVGATHISVNPRLIREADTLAAAGHEVRVICRQVDLETTDHDQRLMDSRNWKLQTVSLCRNGSTNRDWLKAGLAANFFEKVFQAGLRTPDVASRAYVRGLTRVRAAAESEYADWFIAHTQASLPAAASAARKWNSNLGFDCEDLLTELGADPPELVRSIQEKYLPECNYVSFPSGVIAKHFAEEYGLKNSSVLYNVFPTKLADGMLCPSKRPQSQGLRLHWFSRTIGWGRGLEEAIEAAAQLTGEVEIHLRGHWAQGYEKTLSDLADRHGVPLYIHPYVDHDELIKTMDQFDVGLALERPDNGNTARTVSNKIGSFMLAGLAIAATDTPGQREVLDQVPGSGFTYTAGNPAELADGLRKWVGDRSALRNSQQIAWEAARNRFCWDIEQVKFLDLLSSAHEG